MTNIKDFDPSLLNIEQISVKNDKLVIYAISYTKDLNSSNTLVFNLVFNNLDVYIEKNGKNKYLIFASTDKNKMMLEDYTELWDEIKNKLN